MPPKAAKGGGGPSKKNEAKKKEKTIEDKTFGLKNKKGSKQQKFIQQVEKQVHSGNNKTAKQLDKEREQQKLKKEDEKKKLLEMNLMFKPIISQIVQKGVDPKSVLCAYFKEGLCRKGNRCKFSHDLAVERKAEKRSAYVDDRDEQKETSEDWDEEKLKDVVERKHGQEVKANTTQIICKHFLDAVENGKYGWFWSCPGGEKCKYRHALPPGFVLKKDRKRLEKQKETISLEDLIERERAALGAETTKITLESFLAWKKKKIRDKDEQDKKESEKKKNDYKSGKEFGLSGREMFDFNPDLAVGEGDAEEGDGEFDLRNMSKTVEEDDSEDRFQFKEIDFNSLISEYKDSNDNEGCSVANPERLKQLAKSLGPAKIIEEPAVEEAIDEDLFGGDDEDLDDIDEQLEEMNLSS